jgi:hypothetical protein
MMRQIGSRNPPVRKFRGTGARATNAWRRRRALGVGGGGRNHVFAAAKRVLGAPLRIDASPRRRADVGSVARPAISVRADERADNNGLLGLLQPGVLADATPRVGFRRAQALGEFARKSETLIHEEI